MPDRDTGKEIFQIHLAKTPVGNDVITEELAEKTEMFCGAEIPAYDSVAYDQVKTSLSKALAEVQELAFTTVVGRYYYYNKRIT